MRRAWGLTACARTVWHSAAANSEAIPSRAFSHSAPVSDALPRVAQPSIWQSIIPKFLRNRRKDSQASSNLKTQSRKEWNPYTFFIIIFLLIGSNSINMIALRQDFTSFSRQADAKIALLKEAIERVKAGEDVDVKGLLGTGDPQKEREWEEVLREIEEANRAPARSPAQKSDQANSEPTKEVSSEMLKAQARNKEMGNTKDISKPVPRTAKFY